MKKLSKMDLKTKAWAKEYVSNGFNGTKTALKFAQKKDMKKEVANVIAVENLQKPIYIKPIIKEMEDIHLNDTEVSKKLKRNLKQKANISASNNAIEIYHKLKGNFAPERKETINIKLTGEELNRAIEAKIAEYNTLNESREQYEG